MSVKFRKIRIDDVPYEAASVFDVNNDGRLDIVCGEYWYEAPHWTKHKICDILREGEYYDDFSDLPMDVNGDGHTDIVTGGWFGKSLRWCGNPKGQPVEWKVHPIDECGNVETARLWDVDGDGFDEVVPNTPGEPQAYYRLVRDAQGKGTGRFEKVVISQGPSGHGLGFGDINGDGRGDVVLAGGWLEAPEDRAAGPWTFHQEFDLGSASVPVLVHDVDGDGLADLIVGQAHNYGLAWWQQGRAPDGTRTWTRHDIDTTASQYHDMQLADIDNDGQLELVTGKRYGAHCGSDPGADDPVGTYYFKWHNGRWHKHIIDYGSHPDATGVGIFFWLSDLNNNGWIDLIAPGKDGLYLFENLGL